jgi:putative hydrolase of the HAD superfamily
MPVLSIGGHAVHIPYHTTWLHERVDISIEDPHFYEIKTISDILPHLVG